MRSNRIWDNWRRGTMLLAVPDAVSGQTGAGSTSNRNRFHDNAMGTSVRGGAPNGVDNWWDNYPGNTDNCWYNNGAATSDPPGALLPSNCKNTSSGALYPSRGGELGPCAAALVGGGDLRTGGGSNPAFDENICEWFKDPPKPSQGGSSGPSPGPGPLPAPLPVSKAAARDFAGIVDDMCNLVGSSTLSCRAFDRP